MTLFHASPRNHLLVVHSHFRAFRTFRTRTMVVRAARVLSGRFRRVLFRRSPPLRSPDNILRSHPIIAAAATTTPQRCATFRAIPVATVTGTTTSGHRALPSFAASNPVRKQQKTLLLLFVPKRELSVFSREDSEARASSAGTPAGDIQDEVERARGNRERASGTPSSNIAVLGGVASRRVGAEEAVAVGVDREGVGGDAPVKRQRTTRKEKEEDREGKREEDRFAEEEAARIWTLPNAVTMGRICFCPVLGGLIVTSQYELALAGLLVASLTDFLDGYIARKWNQKSVLGGFLDPLADKIMVATVALALGREGIIPEPLVVLAEMSGGWGACQGAFFATCEPRNPPHCPSGLEDHLPYFSPSGQGGGDVDSRVALMVGRDAMLVAASLAHRTLTRKEGDMFFDVRSVEYRVTPSTLSKINTGLQFGTLWFGLTNAVYHIPGDTLFSGLCFLTGGATLASGANYFLESGLKPTNKVGERLVLRRETLREKCLETGALVKEQVDMSRKQFRIKKGRLKNQLKERLREEQEVVAGALKSTISNRKSESHLHESGR